MGDCAVAQTFFTDVKRYPEPNDDEQVAVAEVLDASTAFLPFLDIFGSLLKICKSDLEGNIAKLRAKLEKIPSAKTFKDLLQYELDNKLSQQKDSACIAALWYKRGLQFIVAFLEQFLSQADENIKPVFDLAYEATLKRYHGWIVQKTISVVANMLPYRADVLKKLSTDSDADKQCYTDMQNYLVNMKPVVNYLHNLIVDLGLDAEEKV